MVWRCTTTPGRLHASHSPQRAATGELPVTYVVQVAAPGDPGSFEEVFTCRNCTDLNDPACQIEYLTDLPDYTGFTNVGCWKHGTAVDGNTTWVSLIHPEVVNCFISPDQLDPQHWHGRKITHSSTSGGLFANIWFRLTSGRM